MTGKGIVILVVAATMLGTIMILPVSNAEGQKVTPQYTSHTPIRINNNGDFTQANGIVGGSGTQGDPYRIEGWDINGTGIYYAIYVGNTTAYFTIKNNSLHDAYMSGLYFYNARNGYATGNSYGNDGSAIWLAKSNNNTISNNNLSYNRGGGVRLNDSVDNVIVNNTVNENGNINQYLAGMGISMQKSNRNHIGHNDIIGNYAYGISMLYSNYNHIANNTVSDTKCLFQNEGLGFDILDSNNNTIVNNEVNRNCLYGMNLDMSDDNYLANNTISDTKTTQLTSGIDISSSDNVIFVNNRIIDNINGGLTIHYTHGIRIIGNEIYNNDYGLRLIDVIDSTITHNRIIDSRGYGIFFFSMTSTYNHMDHNILIGNNPIGKQGADDNSTNAWNTTTEGNYWNDFDEPSEGCNDANSNGICDSPYYLDSSKGVKDYYPLTPFPNVVGTSPMNGAKDVTLNATISISFNSQMDILPTQGAVTSSPNIQWTPSWKLGNSTLTFTHSLKLQKNTIYTITVSTSAKAKNGKTMLSPYTFKFTTVQPETYPPYVVSTNPMNNDVNVPINADITIQWNESMNKSSAQNAFSSTPPISCTWSWNGVTQICAHPQNLQLLTKYTITISAIAEDLVGNTMKNPYLFSFTSGQYPDTYPPHLTGTNPKDKSSNIPTTTAISLQWNESMNKSSAEKAFTSNPTITCTWNWNGANQTCAPSQNLTSGTTYAITILSSAKDLAGNHMSSDYSFSFLTTPPDTFPPYVVDTNPKNGDYNVLISAKITVQWNESMNKASSESAFSSIPSITCSWSWSGNDQTCTPGTSLAKSTKYSITISASAKDVAGNLMKSSYYFSFTTEGIPAPKIISTSPINGAKDVPLNTSVTILFDRSMNQISVENAFSISPSITGTFSWNSNGSQVSFAHSNSFDMNKEYAVVITAAAKSTDGIPMASGYTFKFKTTTDKIPPKVLSTNPANGDKDVAITSKIVITFSEEMDKSSVENAIKIIPGTISKREWDASGTNITLTVALQTGKTYTITISTDANDLAGNSMTAPYTFNFTTKSAGISPSGIDMMMIILIIVVVVVIITSLVGYMITQRKKKKRWPERAENSRITMGK